jgi:hypothetical protein
MNIQINRIPGRLAIAAGTKLVKGSVLTAAVVFVGLGAFAGCGDMDATDSTGVSSTASALYTGVGNCPAFDDDSACLCDGPNLTGYCQIFTMGPAGYPNPASFAPFGNDALSSMAIGASVTVIAYDAGQFYYRNVCPVFTSCSAMQRYDGSRVSGQYAQYSTLPGFDNVMSSVRLMNYIDMATCFNGAAPLDGKVAIYTDGGFSGDCVVLSPGVYPNPDWAYGTSGTKGTFGMHNDWMSSVKVSNKAWVLLYNNSGVVRNGQVVFDYDFIDVTSKCLRPEHPRLQRQGLRSAGHQQVVGDV